MIVTSQQAGCQKGKEKGKVQVKFKTTLEKERKEPGWSSWEEKRRIAADQEK